MHLHGLQMHPHPPYTTGICTKTHDPIRPSTSAEALDLFSAKHSSFVLPVVVRESSNSRLNMYVPPRVPMA
jgi:hypothetical protein